MIYLSCKNDAVSNKTNADVALHLNISRVSPRVKTTAIFPSANFAPHMLI